MHQVPSHSPSPTQTQTQTHTQTDTHTHIHTNNDGRDRVRKELEPRNVDHVDKDGADTHQGQRKYHAPRLVVQLLRFVRAVCPRVPSLAGAYSRLDITHPIGLRAVVQTFDLSTVQPAEPFVAVTRTCVRVRVCMST
jgi:hypothetical protein